MNDHHPQDVTAVLVHGAFLGPWIWADTVKLLAAHGIGSVSVDLPSSQETAGKADLHDDAQAVRDALDGCANAVLCGHSYAGAVISEAAAGPHQAVHHLVYLAASIPDVGYSIANLAEAANKNSPAGPETESGGEDIDVRADGRLVLRPESARAGLFHDCTPDRANAAIALLRPQTPAPGRQPITGAAWRDIPSTYVRCAHDRLPGELIAPAFFEHAVDTLTLPTGHCPQWSRPDLVASLIMRIISQVSTGLPALTAADSNVTTHGAPGLTLA